MIMEERYLELKDSLKIDMMRIDDELIRHPSLLQEATEIAADALQVRDACNHELIVTTAQAAQQLRTPDEQGKMPSEAKVSSQVLMDKAVIKARDALEDAKHDLNYWQGMVDSIKEKGSSTKRIAELTIAGYLAPNVGYQQRRDELAEKRGRIKIKPTTG